MPSAATATAASSTTLPTRLGDDSANLELQPAAASCVTFDTSPDATAGQATLSGLASGDTVLYHEFLSRAEADRAFRILATADGPEAEVPYQQWYHMPSTKQPHKPLERLRRIKCAMAVPTPAADVLQSCGVPDATPGVSRLLTPLYRFPVNDQRRYGELTPMTPTVEALRLRAEQVTGHRYNHAVVLLYRNGDDCIGLHKDKSLDLLPGSPIVSISLGAERPYVLRDSIGAPTVQQEFVFRHGSLLALGYDSNQHFYHSVRKLTDAERAASGHCTTVRVSVTFRAVATFKDDATGIVYGQGAAYQTLNWPEELNGGHRLDDHLDEPLVDDDAAAAAAAAALVVEPRVSKRPKPPVGLPEAQCNELVAHCAASLDLLTLFQSFGAKHVKLLLLEAVTQQAQEQALLHESAPGAQRDLGNAVRRFVTHHFQSHQAQTQLAH